MADPAKDGFGRLAGVYEGLEKVAYGGLLMRARVARLNELRHAENIFILGEGDGRFLVRLLAVNPRCTVTVLDSSAGMLRRAEARVAAERPEARERVTFQQGDALALRLEPDTYDALVTCFFLDVFTAELLGRLVPKLERTLKPGGAWLLADFTAPQLVRNPLPRFYSQTMVPLMYSFFRLQTTLPARTLEPPQPFLRAAGLALTRTQSFRGGFVYAQLWRKAGARVNGSVWAEL